MNSLYFTQTSENTTSVRNKPDEREKYLIANSIQKTNEPEADIISPGKLPVTINMKASENSKHTINHNDVFEVWIRVVIAWNYCNN